MKKNLILEDKNRSSNEFKNYLEKILREEARKLLEQAIENEMKEYINASQILGISSCNGGPMINFTRLFIVKC